MPWNNQGGGGQGPWGSGGPGPWGRGPGKSGGPPPDLDAWLKRGREALGNLTPGGQGPFAAFGLIAIGALALWLFSGIYRVQPSEEGVVLRFGAYSTTTQPGLHYHWPWPIESVEKPVVAAVNQTDIGTLAADDAGRGAGRGGLPSDSLMLTGDENIVDVNLSVFWVIKDARAYLFGIRNPDLTVKSAAESAVREIVGRTLIASVQSEGRAKVEAETQDLLQSILDAYGAGIRVTQVQLQRADPPATVIDAYRDVQRARTDLERARNEAEAYRNDIVPRARGDAEKLIQDAEAYKQEVVARAQGDAGRFLSVLGAYRAAKDVTAERLYLETMEKVLKNAQKVIVDKGAGIQPFQPLPALVKPEVPK